MNSDTNFIWGGGSLLEKGDLKLQKALALICSVFLSRG